MKSVKRLITFEESVKIFRKNFQKSLKNKKVQPKYKPRYDKVYEEGVAWLNSL